MKHAALHERRIGLVRESQHTLTNPAIMLTQAGRGRGPRGRAAQPIRCGLVLELTEQVAFQVHPGLARAQALILQHILHVLHDASG